MKSTQPLMSKDLPLQSSNTSPAPSAQPVTGRRFPVAAVIVSMAVIFAWGVGSARASSLVRQTQLEGKCIPEFATPLPVFGPAGSIPRVLAAAHPNLTITMEEIDQSVLPQGKKDLCNKGITFGKTRVWAYQTSDTNTGQVLGPANWPAVTIDAEANVATQVTYVNQLPAFNPSDPTGPGLVQGELPVDQTLHWADPLQTGCGMMTIDCSVPSSSASATDELLQPVNYCGRVAAFKTGRLAASQVSNVSETANPSPCCQQYFGPVPAAVHLHGAVVTANFDGDPDSWFTPNGITGPDYNTMGNPGPGKATYKYPNSQEPGTLWFHDHALGVTRLDVASGLAGFYFLRDPSTEPKGLPSGAYEIEMALQDREFDTKSQLYFPDQVPLYDHSFWSPMYDADVAMVNGAPWPYLKVEPRRYRFRLLNGSNHRGYTLSFGDAPVYAIGADENYLDTPAKESTVNIESAERADIIVDFSKMAGKTITVTNSEMSEINQLPKIMQIRVVLPLKGKDTSCDPAEPDTATGVCARQIPLVRLTDGQGHVAPGVKIDKVRQLVLNDEFDPPVNIEELVNNTKWDGLKSPSIAVEFPTDGVSEVPQVGSTEEWDIINIFDATNQAHPVHMHLTQFQILNRQKIRLEGNNGYLAAWDAAFGSGPAPLPASCTPGQFCVDYGPPLSYNTPNADGAFGGNPAISPFLIGSPTAPDVAESGWKDTAVSYGTEVIRLLVRWTPTDVPVIPNQSYAGQNLFHFDPTQGYYVWHCHIIDHEDNEMMRPLKLSN
ncbi:MAG: multicopper oxidase domain-containing protein [Candidatus Binataceae bacterium]